MRVNMRVVAAALIVLTIGVSNVLAQSGADDPFGGADPFGPSQPKALKKVKQKVKRKDEHKALLGHIHSVLKEPLSSIKARSCGISVMSETPAYAKIRRALDEKTNLQFQEAELAEVVTYLKKLHNIEIQLDKESLEELDLGSDTLVTCMVKNISLRSALKLMLRDLDLTYIFRDEVLLITTEEVALENLETRIYDVADLVTYRDEKGVWTDYEPLIDVLSSSIRPDSWIYTGGMGSIKGDDFGTARILVVSQTEKIHSQIVGVLTAIRHVAAQHPGDGQPPWRSRPKAVPLKPMANGAAEGKPNPADNLPRGMMGGMGGGGIRGGMMSVRTGILPAVDPIK